MLTVQKDDPLPAKSGRLPKWEISFADFGIFVSLLLSLMVVVSLLARQLTLWAIGPVEGETLPLIVILAESIGVQLGGLAAFLAFGLVAPIKQSEHAVSASKGVVIGLKWLLYSYPILFVVGLLWRFVLDFFGINQVLQEPVQMVLQGGEPVERALIYLMVVAIAPICEELIFRAGIFRFLHLRSPIYIATGISAVFFALMHFNAYSFAPLVVLGVTLALAYRESGNIISSMVLHAAFNTISLTLLLVFPEAV